MQLARASGKLLAAALGRHGTPLAFGAGVVGATATNIYHDAGRTESVRRLVGWLDAFVFDFVERADAGTDGDARWRSHNPRVVLGVDPLASRAACRAAYLRLARLYHPDKSGNAATSEAFRAVVAAWHAVS